MSIVFLLKQGINYGEDVSRQGGDININIIGMVSGISCSFAFYFYKYDRTLRWKYSMLIFAGVFMFIILLTASRKSLFIPFLVYSIFKLIGGSNKRALFNILVISLFLFFILWSVLNIPLLYDMIGYRIDGFLNGYFGEEEDVDGSTRTRMELVEFGLIVFYLRPFLGYGINNFRAVHTSYFGQEIYAHNNYIELLVDLGVVGLVIYYVFYLYLIVKLYQIYKKYHDHLALIFFAIIIALVIVHYGFVAFYSPFNNIILTIATCYTLVKSNMSKQSSWELRRRNF